MRVFHQQPQPVYVEHLGVIPEPAALQNRIGWRGRVEIVERIHLVEIGEAVLDARRDSWAVSPAGQFEEDLVRPAGRQKGKRAALGFTKEFAGFAWAARNLPGGDDRDGRRARSTAMPGLVLVEGTDGVP